MPQEVSLRETYGQTLVELGRENPDIVVLDADLSRSTMTYFFAKEFPNPKRLFVGKNGIPIKDFLMMPPIELFD